MSEQSADPVDVVDEPLRRAVLEIESHVAEGGWDQGGRLYALVDTAALVSTEPELGDALGLDPDASPDEDSLTAVEQDQLPPEQSLEEMLETIAWPQQVDGCAAVVERLVLPPASDQDIPEDPASAEEFAREHPDRQEVRIVAAAARGGSTYCAMRLRAHDDDVSVITGTDLVPGLLELLSTTLIDEDPDDPHDASNETEEQG